MAKRKNRKKNQTAGSCTPGQLQAQVVAAPAPTVTDDTAIKQSKTKKEIARPARGMRVSSCIAGMFMTFVMGVYLGTLMPGIVHETGTVKQTAEKENREAPAPDPANKPREMPRPDLIPEDQPASRTIPDQLAKHLASLEKSAAQNPENPQIWIELGNHYFDAGQSRKAISAYEHALHLSPGNTDVLVDMGIMYREEKNFEKALDCFRQAYEIDPWHINALFNAGVVLGMDLHRPEEAANLWRQVVKINPEARTPDGKKVSDLIQNQQ